MDDLLAWGMEEGAMVSHPILPSFVDRLEAPILPGPEDAGIEEHISLVDFLNS